MPCYTITEIETVTQKMRPDLAHAALAAMDLYPQSAEADGTIRHRSGRFNPLTGEATWRGQDRTADLKREYALAAVNSMARKYRLSIQATGENRYSMTATIGR